MDRIIGRSCVVLTLAFAVLSAGVTAQKKDADAKIAAAAAFPELIWQDPGAPATLDLTYGIGGRAHAPDPAGTFTFVKEDTSGSSPKFEVTDAAGVLWKVKLGDESRPETAATRFLWAAGYFTDEDYYLAKLTVQGLPKLNRGQEFAIGGGVVRGARLERKSTSVEKLGDWDWFDNPFVGKRELNGLRVMMSLMNSWDLKQVNNSVYSMDAERRFVVSDVGAAFGKTGGQGVRNRDVPEDYAGSKFINKVEPDYVDLVMNSRPFFLFALSVGSYRERTRMQQIAEHIPRADARWLGQRLSVLTDEQIRDGFRCAGYTGRDLDMLATTIRQRIAALGAL